eukprot:10960573-Alexandrium_andersonii.AAC.1
MARGLQARFACKRRGRATRASSYWCLRCLMLLRHCGCPRAAASEAAGQQRDAGASSGRQATLDRWLRGQRAQATSQQA